MSKHSSLELLKTRRFLPFFCTQFLGAFNDNVFKNSLVILIAMLALKPGGPDANLLVNLCSGLFILPFFLFSATAGQLADAYEKSRLIRYVKLFEIGIMLLASVGFYFSSLPLLICALFLMGTHSAIFGPVKYGILPQHLRESELVGGNGLVEMGTFVAILLGTLLGGILINRDPSGFYVSIGVVVIAVLGYFTSRGIPRADATAPDLKINWNIATETLNILRYTRQNRTVFLSVLGISWFWFFGSVFLTQLPNYTPRFLGGDAPVITVLLATFSIGVGLGSMLCERLSGHKVEIGLVPFGSIGLSLFGIDLYFSVHEAHVGPLVGALEFIGNHAHWRTLADLFFVGVFGGFYIVPLYALIQSRSEPAFRSRIIAGNNVLNALFMVVAAGMSGGLLAAGVTIPQLFLIVAVLNAAVALYIYTLVPEFLMRFLVWILIHTMYRVKHLNLQNVPEEGAAVLVANHVSFVDALVVAGCCRRPVRFVMDHNIFKVPVLSFIFRTAKAIPIAPAKEDPSMKEKAFDAVAEALAAGEIVCIFPEGKITYDGQMNPFKPGIEEIVKRTPVPVIPLALQGLWGSFFSRRHGAAMQKLPRRFWSRIGIIAGQPIPPAEVSAAGLQEKVASLRGDWL